MAILVIQKGYNRGAAFRLGQRPLTIGRDPGNLIQIVDSKASRRHATISFEAGAHVVRDLGSPNGVFVNGARVSEARLAEGDRIAIGSALMVVEPDHDLAVDGALARKVVDRKLTEGATHVVDVGTDVTVSDLLQKGETVDVDAASYREALRQANVLHGLKAAVKAGDRVAACQKALEGLDAILAPDRAFVLEIDAANRLQYVAMRYADELDAAHRRVRLHAEMLNRALRSRQAVQDNALAADAADPLAVASALVAPVLGPSGRPALVVYADSFADNPQAFLPHELAFLEKLAARLGPLAA